MADGTRALAHAHRAGGPGGNARTVRFRLRPSPPFRLDLTVWTLRRRAENTVDRWDGTTYRRVLPLDGQPVEVAVTQLAPPTSPQLQVSVTAPPTRSGVKAALAPVLERMLGLRVDLGEFYRMAAHDARLAPLAEGFRGMRPPRFPTIFEAVVNGIACQQLSLTVGITLLGRLSRAFGVAAGAAKATARAFPRPEDLAVLDPRSLRPLGFSQQKSRAIVEAAGAVCAGRIDLESLADAPDAEAIQRLEQLRGVGRWTAQYVLLRGLGRWHVFPGDDVGARNALAHWLRLRKPLDYAGVARALSRCQGYGGLVYFHLLLDGLRTTHDIP